ncbi:ribonuclease P protein component [Patescibacteria group bacterium]|nr:ribonuclease P protein component [Patescibacteria group bacterium]
MLSRERRLTSSEYGFILEVGELVKKQSFSLVVFFLDDKRPTRFGITVSKRLSPLAVKRNRLKRLFKVSFLSLVPKLQNGWLVVVLPRGRALDLSFELVTQELESSLRQAGVFLK